MASLPFIFGAATSSRVFIPKATKGAVGSTTEEKGFVDWLLGNLTKDDQFFETDPILQKVEGKASSVSITTNGRKTSSVSVQTKEDGGTGNGGFFGGLFAKKE